MGWYELDRGSCYLPKIIDRGTGAGTVNDSYAYGGRCATEGYQVMI